MSFSSAESSPIDLEQLQQISGNDPEFEQELLQLFVEDAIAQTAILEEAIAQQNSQAIEETAHHLKGASANVGATSMAETAAQLEVAARHQQSEQHHRLFKALQQGLDEVRHYLNGLDS
ncbi:Hpt domain-containing protein [Almyronema epifaneia]|uniref:Hpt domain-containing protein n=1 Tax=Almyronema epifaneia S1 TaxID=2991925 RepID=A0ABW6IF70_9CYAN